MPARSFDASERSDKSALEAFKEQGVEVIELKEDDVNAARVKAVESWRKATKGNDLATRILDSQVAQMQELGLIQ